MIQTYKIIHGIEAIASERFFTAVTNLETREHKHKLEKKTRCKTSFRLQHFSQRIINVLRTEVLRSFKCALI